MVEFRSLTEAEFERLLSDFVRPAKAVTTAQHLHGRAESLKRVRRALRSEGAQAFIFGERGVGKTSLAKTVLAEFCPDHATELLVACDSSSTFITIMAAISRRLISICKKTAKQTEIKAGFQAFGFSLDITKVWENTPEINMSDLNSIISLMKALNQILRKPIAVIIDEFDLIIDLQEKAKFAELVKQLSDQDVGIKFIFCGIAEDIDSLIGGHFSAGRYIEPIELGTLKLGAIFAIFENACRSFHVEWDNEVKIRAGLIADGYPYFMHLIAFHTLDILFERTDLPLKITPAIFEEAVRRSVERAEPMLKNTYDTATKKYHDEYEQVLWAVAAPTLMENKWDDIFTRAYEPIVARAVKGEKLNKEKFYRRISNLTRDDHGKILNTNKNGWYKFSENVVRSYVRLRAAESNVDLGIDVHGYVGKFRPDAGGDVDIYHVKGGEAFEPTLPLK